MKKYESDSPIVEEVRAARKAFWAEYNNDIDRVFEAVKISEKEARERGVKFADDLKPSLPNDFHERLRMLKEEKIKV